MLQFWGFFFYFFLFLSHKILCFSWHVWTWWKEDRVQKRNFPFLPALKSPFLFLNTKQSDNSTWTNPLCCCSSVLTMYLLQKTLGTGSWHPQRLTGKPSLLACTQNVFPENPSLTVLFDPIGSSSHISWVERKPFSVKKKRDYLSFSSAVPQQKVFLPS